MKPYCHTAHDVDADAIANICSRGKKQKVHVPATSCSVKCHIIHFTDHFLVYLHALHEFTEPQILNKIL